MVSDAAPLTYERAFCKLKLFESSLDAGACAASRLLPRNANEYVTFVAKPFIENLLFPVLLGATNVVVVTLSCAPCFAMFMPR